MRENPGTWNCFVSLRIRSFRGYEHPKQGEGEIRGLDCGTKGGTLGKSEATLLMENHGEMDVGLKKGPRQSGGQTGFIKCKTEEEQDDRWAKRRLGT